MLRLHFINVGDGDAILVEELREGSAFRMLVDTGREDVGGEPGSLRRTAAEYLAELGITGLDALVVTHLHEDHFGGTAALAEKVSIGTVYSGFFPCLPVASITRTGAEEKTVRGLMDCLERWASCVEKLTAHGCRLCQVEETAVLSLAPRLEAELICDGIHIHPATVRQTFKMFGDDRIILISDSMEATGMPDGEYALGGQKVIKKGNVATLEDGTIAGSATNLMDCLRIAVQKMQIPLESAVKCAAVNPARSVGIYDRYGSITPGKKAHFLLLDKETLDIRHIIKGRLL